MLLEVWRSASRFDPDRGSAAAWALTIAHRRAVDRVRSESAGSRREQKVALDRESDDDVAETVAATLDHLAGVVQAALEPAHLTIWTVPRNL